MGSEEVNALYKISPSRRGLKVAGAGHGDLFLIWKL